MNPVHLDEALRLLAITDDMRDGQDGLVRRVAAAVRGGATMIQVRLKDATGRELVEVTRAMVGAVTVPVLVNDRADVAIAAGAAGVHLGAQDLPVSDVRRFAPPGFIIGASVGTLEEHANADGADYIGVGPVFPTLSKQDAGSAIAVTGMSSVLALSSLPAVAIGGVTVQNAADAVRGGAAGVAVISAIFGAADPEQAARELRQAMNLALA